MADEAVCDFCEEGLEVDEQSGYGVGGGGAMSWVWC